MVQLPALVGDQALPTAGSGGVAGLPEAPPHPAGPVSGRVRSGLRPARVHRRRHFGTSQPVRQPPDLVAAVFLPGRDMADGFRLQEAGMIKTRWSTVESWERGSDLFFDIIEAIDMV